LWSCPLHCVAFAQWVISLRDMASSFRGPQFSWRCFPCTVTLLYNGTPSCRWQPTSSESTISSCQFLWLCFALQVDASPCATSSVFWLVSLQHLT
jgi:hypothetical protein